MRLQALWILFMAVAIVAFQLSCTSPVLVIRAIDGDTIEVTLDGEVERVRYYSIDAPELDESGGAEAWEANARLIEGGVVLLLPEPGRARDVYGRLLRNVFTPDGDWIEAALVEGGYATWRR